MRIAMLAGAVALAVPMGAAEAKTVVVEFDDLDYEDVVYEEQGFQFSFDGMEGNYGYSYRYGNLALQDGGTGSTSSAVITASDGSEFQIKKAMVNGVQRSSEPYDSARVRGYVGGEVVGETTFLPVMAFDIEERVFDFGLVDQVRLDFAGRPLSCDVSPCSSIFYDTITFEVPTAPVPVPAAASLLLLGLGGLGWAARRRKG